MTTAAEIANRAAPEAGTRPQVPALFVAVEGPTGAGKSTLAPRLARRLGATVFSDPFQDNPFLDDLHHTDRPDRDERALRIELTFFALRIPQLRQVRHVVAGGTSVVADWCLVKQPVFASLSCAPADAERIAAACALWSPSLPAPDALIGLSAQAATLRERITRRGRAVEAGITDKHLSGLARAFDAAFDRYTGNILRVRAETFDAYDPGQIESLADQVVQLTASH